jgi:hypothetical protein
MSKPWQDPHPPTIRKVPVDSVPYGASISTNGRTVFAAYDGERLVCVAASATEARRKYREAYYVDIIATRDEAMRGGSKS